MGQTMNALSLEKVGDLRLCRKEIPSPGPGEVLLKISACGVCGSDIPRIYQKGTYHFPTVPGHEFAGVVTALGEGVDESWLHRAAAVFPLLPCRSCEACASGEWALCAHYDYFGSRRDGAFAEYLAVPLWNLIPLPEGLSPVTAAMVEPAAVALHALRRGGLEAGDTVAVFGAGPVGLLVALWARSSGARVFVADIDPRRLAFARDLGFTAFDSREGAPKAILEATGGRGVDLAVEGAGVAATLGDAILSARKFGRVVCMGNPAGDMKLDQKTYWEILRRQLTLQGTWNSSFSCAPKDEWRLALSAMADGRLPAEKLITHQIPLTEGIPALEMLRDKTEFACKMMLIP